MSDYIKREDAKAKSREEWVKYVPISADLDINLSFILAKLEDTPSADVVERKRGEWTNAGILTVHCSNCKSEFHELEAMNFCPNCGADMRGNEE